MYSRGSEWREWDLHIHSPASFEWSGEKFAGDAVRNDQLLDEMINALNGASPAAYCLMDYWHFDGWFALKKRRSEETAPKLKKTLFPGIELRLVSPMKARLNAHVMFSDDIPDQHLRDFLSHLKVELVNRPLSSNALIEVARFVGKDKLAVHGFTKEEVDADDEVAYLAGCKVAEINTDSYKEAIRKVPDGRAIGFMPFSTNDGLQEVDWSTHYAYTLGLFESSPIFETRDPNLWAAFCGIETPGNAKWVCNFQAALRDLPRLAVSGSDAHCFVGNGKDKRGYGDYPSGKRTWIKADPTWKGLLQALKEPAKRSFLGARPPKLERINENKTFYIDRISIKKVDGSMLADKWLHEVEIPLNPDLVAVIGNKGSGKSALADILALLGNSQQGAHFSFLKKERFRGKNGEPARQFLGKLTWLAGDPREMSLAEDPAHDRVELVRYIPQGRFEALCNEHVSGKTEVFEKELRAVIFSHVPKDVRLDALDFDQLISAQEATFRARTEGLRSRLRTLSQQLVADEDQLNPGVRANLVEQIALKERQRAEHLAIKPQAEPAPTDRLTTEQYQASGRLAEISAELEKLSVGAKALTDTRQGVGRKARTVRSIRDRIAFFQRQYDAFTVEIAADLELAELKVDDIISMTIKDAVLTQSVEKLVAEEAEIDLKMATLAGVRDGLIAEQAPLVEKLNEPQKKYQTYVQALQIWQTALDVIDGSDTDPESLKGLQRRLTQIDELPALLKKRREERQGITSDIFSVLEEQRVAREAFFVPLQSLIQSNALIRDDYKLQFQARLLGSPESIATNLFSDIKQIRGELRGDEESLNAIRIRFDKYAFNQPSDAVGFANDIDSLLTASAGEVGNAPGIRSLMRKDREPASVYSYVFGLEYLEPKYTLMFQDTPIEQLSPGQRGALLLIFYLLVDKGRNPIVLDQPEENLDNETVVSLLVPVLNEAKRSRQIIMVTHNPNLAVVCDAEQIIHATFDRKSGPSISYNAGSIEDGTINKAVVDILEGTKIAFNNRGQKYH
ncbi:TrlF family AAA-like ATPase [Mesorhizobium shangrilense]|uniref:TrlF family AAA-like ATPase n=1 Tax=Mesorhizobium shangrilense TaxID=460060 RepID=A0ABV2DGZ3_9HYPH